MKSEQLAWLIRRHGIEMTHRSGAGHIGSVLSVADLVAVLYADVLRFRPDDPAWEKRDRFILSKGHAAAAVYAALAECGFFPKAELLSFYSNGSRLLGHVSHEVPGVEFSTGALGYGLSAGAGMALTAMQDGKDFRVFTILGDGECNEGSVWEAAMFAKHFRLSNLTALVDYNHLQSLDTSENTMALEDLGEKWAAFGWNVRRIDGHDHDAIRAALTTPREKADCPLAVIADTVKGKGVSFMENDVLWHYRYPHEGWEYDCAVTELYRSKPEGVEDPYTPDGIADPVLPGPDADLSKRHNLSEGYHPRFPKR